MARKDLRQDAVMQGIAEGRSLKQQVAYIKKQGNLGGPTALRNRLLGALDVVGSGRKAENLIIFGCYIPFRIPLSVPAYTTLLDRLGLEWTFLEKEYCCGLPMVEMTQGEQREAMVEAAKEFLYLNLSREGNSA